MFTDWPKEKLGELCRQSMTKVFQTKNQKIFKQGENIVNTVFIKEGKVRL